jgi:hypothetical protein
LRKELKEANEKLYLSYEEIKNEQIANKQLLSSLMKALALTNQKVAENGSEIQKMQESVA